MVLKMILGAIVGGAIGFLYYKKVGCPTGSCPITSSPINATAYGAVMGLMAGSIV